MKESPDGRVIFRKENHSYRLDGEWIPSVSKILRDSGALGSSLDWLRRNRPGFLEFAASRGTAVHKAVEILETHELDDDSVHESIRPYIDAYRDWRAGFDLDVVSVETIVYNPQPYAYAGTVDVVARDPESIGGEGRILLDWKTSAKVYHSHRLQLAAYAFAAGPDVTKAGVVRIRPDGVRVTWIDLDRFIPTWESYLDVFWDKQRNVK